MTSLAYLLLFLLPFERIPSVDIQGVTVRFSSLLILGFILIGIPWLLRQRKILPLSLIDRTILVYYATVLLSVIGAAAQSRSLLTAGLIGFVFCGYLLISRAFRDNFNFERISHVLIISAFVTSLFGVYQFWGDSFGLYQHWTGLLDRYTSHVFGFPRIQSVGLEPLYYANFLLFPILILITRILTAKDKPEKSDVWLLGFMSYVFILALSRGAYIGILTGVIILWLLLWWQKMPRRHWRTLGLIMLTAFALSYLSVRVVSGAQGARYFGSHAIIAEGAGEASSASPRLERYREAVRLFKEHPIFGVGVSNFGIVSHFPRQKTGGFEIVNNQYLETLAETGLIGFLALLSVMVAVALKLIKALRGPNKLIAITMLASVAAIAMQYNFFSTIYVLHIWALIGLVDALPIKAETQA